MDQENALVILGLGRGIGWMSLILHLQYEAEDLYRYHCHAALPARHANSETHLLPRLRLIVSC